MAASFGASPTPAATPAPTPSSYTIQFPQTNYGTPDKNGWYPGQAPAGYDADAVYSQHKADLAEWATKQADADAAANARIQELTSNGSEYWAAKNSSATPQGFGVFGASNGIVAGGAPASGASFGGGVNSGGSPGSSGSSSSNGAGGYPTSSGSGIVSGYQQSTQLGSPTAWNVTPDQTVQGRIDSIINPNSPIIQQAQAQSRIDAASRGLSNTSMAETAGQAAAYQAATPIAQADAATYAKAAGYNADQANQFAAKNVDASNQFALADKNIQGQKDLANINRDTQLQIGKMNIDAQAIANKMSQDNQTLISTNGNAAQSFNQALAAVNNINLSTTMDADKKTMAIANVWHDVDTQLKAMGSMAGLNLTRTLNFSNYPGFDAQGNWIGFSSGAPLSSVAPAQIAQDNPIQGGGGA